MAAKSEGLILDLPGAPDVPHMVRDVPGLYRPSIPTPLHKDISADRAKEIDADEGVPLKLAPITNADAAEAAASDALADSRNAQREAKRKRVKGSEATRVNEEIEATKGAN